MNCFNHPEHASVASCIDCGKGLCKTCVTIYAIPICNRCNTKRVQNEKDVIRRKYIPSITSAFIGFLFTIILTVSNKASQFSFSLFISQLLGYTYIFAGIPWGWTTLNCITPKVFLILSWFGWVVYFGIKVFLAIIIGIIAMPIGIIRLLIKQKTRN